MEVDLIALINSVLGIGAFTFAFRKWWKGQEFEAIYFILVAIYFKW